MSFRLRWTAQATATFHELQRAAEQSARTRAQASKRSDGKKRTKSSKQEGLFKQVAKDVELLAENPRHTSLNTHEYDSLKHPFDPKAKVFEAYAQNKTQGAYRIFWCCGPEKDEMTIIAITPHP